MKFGIFYEHQLPRPWTDGAEQRLFNEALDQVSDKVKLILLDLRLAKGSGLDFCRKLKKQGRVIPAIIMTAYPIEEKHQIDELRLLSIDQVIRKPFHPKELISAIEAIAI